MATLHIAPRFCGPPGTANGGYLAGSLSAASLGQAMSVRLNAPTPPDFAAATRASRRFIAFGRHAFPGCFVCGDARGTRDGLRIFAGATDNGSMVAAPWLPDDTVADRSGRIPHALLWAAIDCPGYFAARDDGQPMLLGEITGRVDVEVRVGEACVVTGWRERSDGRKHLVGTALYNADGALCAQARALWIAPRPA